MSETEEVAWCCVPGCDKDAEWNIYRQGDAPDLQTQACTDHVGTLLQDGWHDVWPVES